MIESTPFITPVEPEPVTTTTTTSFLQSQVPLVQSTQILQPQPVITSQVVQQPSVIVSTPAYTAPQVSYVPAVSSFQPPAQQPIRTGVKVVPIYDDF